MLIPCKIHVITTAHDIRSLYAIYLHKDADSVVKYVGVTPLSELFALTDATSNSLWADHFGKPVTTLEIEVVAMTDSEREAYKEQHRLIGVHNPICNRRGFMIDPRQQQVQCVETGELYANATECARLRGLSLSQLTNHLNRKPGHKSVKGHTFIRTSRNG